MASAKHTSQIPSHQLVGYHGVGSIYELRTHWKEKQATLHSVMVAGLDYWNTDALQELHDPVLESILGVRKFYMPSLPDDEKYSKSAIPVVRFPRWLVCNRCHRLGKVPQEFNDIGFSGPVCNAAGCKGHGVPVRLVVACRAGHIDDFPWAYWAHGGKDSCNNPALRLTVQPGTTSLGGLMVSCLNPDCTDYKKEYSLGRALHQRFLCTGNRPWLNDREGCTEKGHALFRHSSTIYFPDVVSAVSIPPYSQELYQRLQKVAARDISRIQSAHKRGRDIDWEEILDSLRDDIRWLANYTDDQIIHALQSLAFINENRLEDHMANERLALLNGYPEIDRSVFVATPVPSEALTPNMARLFQSLVGVDRLRVVQVLNGFSRITHYGVRAALSKNDFDWKPAVELHGEGIYLEFNRDSLLKWAAQSNVRARVKPLADLAGDHQQEKAHPVSIFLHTLAHLLIKQLSLDSGYGMGALRERLYVNPREDTWMAGILIYVAATTATGTLGGLVRQANPARLEELLYSIYEEAQWCSSDPLCLETDKPVDDVLNLAACHACCLISETSCDWRNQFLDRALVVGLPGEESLGFLSGMLGEQTIK
ncbi:hypothetical protein TPY_0080 [Sulfobacillus acidophilus TPY]|uniref:MrfA-like Zn-binding domain-containing protein n=1 Tax=Sulfobacillus acidophilus (strain ATCC 700253 / DSM 10332 / NAL) TaxID=679936 RepID=G8TVK8_SULAD|nr:hypothetical protein TPY_0080 [Sulfobacillus acidophilus TPY]AEW03647.1 Protein of unknown function DUF1998 [Sulfobacillus acidophilus DSM 10332]